MRPFAGFDAASTSADVATGHGVNTSDAVSTRSMPVQAYHPQTRRMFWAVAMRST